MDSKQVTYMIFVLRKSSATSPTSVLENQILEKGQISNSRCSDLTEVSKETSSSETCQDLKKNECTQSIKSPINKRNLNMESLIQLSNEKTKVTQLDVPEQSSLGVVLDIACCDGPIKFHRILNQNYTASASGLRQQQQSQLRSKAPSYPSVENQEIFEENDENGRPEDTSEVDETIESTSGSSGSYNCSFCPHTFKSQYCYIKHRRKHILPAQNEINQQTEGARRREVRFLDLNVQYYPCKICGSKFPSYYFVHKHKKLCHADEQNSDRDRSHPHHVASASSTGIY